MHARYAFLVDALGRVRWRGSGPATADELEAMLKLAKTLAQQPLPGKQRP